MAKTTNREYGIAYALYFDALGRLVARTFGPETFGPNYEAYAYRIHPTKMGSQPQRWTAREMQEVIDEETY